MRAFISRSKRIIKKIFRALIQVGSRTGFGATVRW